MMNVATIGSGVIVERMIEAMRLDGRYNLYCVYSRTKKRAKEFAEKHGIQKYYTDMEEMLNDENVDIVYVASPNSLHYSQSKMALEHKKHVINEKPFTPTLKECNELFEIAEKRGWDKSPSLSIIFGLSSKTQWLSGLYYADFISFYSPTQLCGGGTTKSNSNELPISVPLSFLFIQLRALL